MADKRVFIHKLAEFLAGRETAKKSIEYEMGKRHAIEWVELRSATPLFGYPTVEEAEEILLKFLS